MYVIVPPAEAKKVWDSRERLKDYLPAIIGELKKGHTVKVYGVGKEAIRGNIRQAIDYEKAVLVKFDPSDNGVYVRLA